MSRETGFDGTEDAEDETRRSSSVDLLSDGVLWAINRCVYHPRGFALALDSELGGFTLHGNGTEPWCFQADAVEDEKFAAHEALLERARLHNTP